jgi:putative oxidoreductase
MTNQSARWGVTILRVSVASVFLVHGITRLVLGTVGGFGSFLEGSGIPGGTAVAWTITVVEVVGGLALAHRFGGSWSSNGVCMAKLWPFFGYNIRGQSGNTTFRVT